MEHNVTTTDLYESTYYLLHGAELLEITGIKVNGRVACELTFSKPNIIQLQISYLQGKAEVNLIEFRRAFGQVLSWVNSSRKKFKNQLKNNTPQDEEGEA